MPRRAKLNADPLPWLLEPDNPSVRYFALRDLVDRPDTDTEGKPSKWVTLRALRVLKAAAT
jgi:hypothetical protein